MRKLQQKQFNLLNGMDWIMSTTKQILQFDGQIFKNAKYCVMNAKQFISSGKRGENYITFD